MRDIRALPLRVRGTSYKVEMVRGGGYQALGPRTVGHRPSR
jgi:hypothetical protein